MMVYAYRLLDAFEFLFGRSQGHELVGTFDFDGRWVWRRPVLNPLQQEIWCRAEVEKKKHIECCICASQGMCVQKVTMKNWRKLDTVIRICSEQFTHFYTLLSCCMGLWVGEPRGTGSCSPCMPQSKQIQTKYLLNFNFHCILYIVIFVVAGIVASFEFWLREWYFYKNHFVKLESNCFCTIN